MVGTAVAGAVAYDMHQAEKEAEIARKRAEEERKRAEKARRDAEEAARKARQTMPPPPPPKYVGTVKPISYHINIISRRVSPPLPSHPVPKEIEIYYDATAGGWRACTRGCQPNGCKARGMKHNYTTLPYYVAFSVPDANNQAVMLFSEKSCAVCGRNKLRAASHIPYAQCVAMSHPQILTEVGVPGAPPMAPMPGMAPPPPPPSGVVPPPQPYGAYPVPQAQPVAYPPVAGGYAYPPPATYSADMNPYVVPPM